MRKGTFGYCQVNRFGTYLAPWPLSKLLILRSTDDRLRLQNPRILLNLTAPFKGLKEETGEDRLHQFVRSLEALILPKINATTRQFAHRYQTFARAGKRHA